MHSNSFSKDCDGVHNVLTTQSDRRELVSFIVICGELALEFRCKVDTFSFS